MNKLSAIVPRWAPAIILMAVIFFLSAQPSAKLPKFDLFDTAIKKGGHFIGYGLLALSYLYGFRERKNRYMLAWLFAVLYAVTDEFHQSFVPGRDSSIWDMMIFDNFGAVTALYWHHRRRGKRGIDQK